MQYIFDLDGTILDTSERYYFIYYKIVKEFGGDPLSKNMYWDYKRDKVSENEIMKASHLHQSYSKEYKTLRQEYIESDHYLKLDKIWPELFDFIPTSKIFNKILLLTFRQKKQQLITQLENLGILNWFEKILTVESSDQRIDRDKLKADRILKSCSSDLKGILVGDTETDIKTGKLLGLKTIAVSFGIRNLKHLTHENPNVILNSPQELVEFIKNY
jgi:phosphoglycolate phosphatase